ncbi:MAG: Cysteine desulfurase SufS [Elusimicrobia bacterium]|nr:Cysteine desulfurase SufS [Elusimicrobiota bacterium]
MNFSSVRKDFPLLSRVINGKPVAYLDSASTTQKPQAVIDALTRFYQHTNANIHRGVYAMAEESTALYENTRKRVAQFIHAPHSDSVIFTRNTTESINLAAHSWARKHLKAGDEILVTDLEHHANFVPWYMLSKERGVVLKSIPIDSSTQIDMEAYEKLLTPRVKLVAATAMSNVLGTITPAQQMASLAHRNGALFLLDGAQSVPHMTTDVQTLDCDFLAFSAHKMLGPTGVGVLWVRENILKTMDPFMGGGEMINTVSIEKTTWAEPPLKFEAGTSNYADTAVFSTALDYLEGLGMPSIRQHEKELVGYALEKLSAIPDITVYGPKDPEKQGGAISFNHKVVHSHDVGSILGEEGVAIRVGHHCAQPLMKVLGTSSTARASFYVYSTKEDVDALVRGLNRVNEVFGLKSTRGS